MQISSREIFSQASSHSGTTVSKKRDIENSEKSPYLFADGSSTRGDDTLGISNRERL